MKISRRYTRTSADLRLSALICGLLILMLSHHVSAQKKRDEAEPIVKPTTGTLSIVSKPVGANIFINNKPIGKTDANGLKELSLKGGGYNVLVTYPEYENFARKVTVEVGKGETVAADLTAKFGYVLLTSNNIKPDAKIEIDRQPPAKNSITVESDAAVTNIKIKTVPGAHAVSVVQRGYSPFSKKVEVAPGERPAVVTVALERILAALAIKAPPGTRIYLNDASFGEIPNTGELKIPDLEPEQPYKALLELDGYEKYEKTVAAEAGKEALLEAVLTPLPESTEYFDQFLDLGNWDHPGWKVNNQTLYVGGNDGQPGFPKERRYRNCYIKFGLRFGNLQGAAWILHAKTEKNFYLFYIGGPNGKYAKQFRVYIVRDGLIDLDGPAAKALPLIFGVSENQTYEFEIEVGEKTIECSVTPQSTGEKISFALFQDPKQTYSYGNVGFVALDNQNFQVSGLVVKPK